MLDLAVPYLSQINNVERPLGSCNVTSVGMCLKFLAKDRNFGCPSNTQLEDFLFRKMQAEGLSRHSPYDLQLLINGFEGFKDEFTTTASLADIRAALSQGYPCIAHLWLTYSGHIIVIRGYEGNKFIVNDPAGEWSRSGYAYDRSGERLMYSDRLIAAAGITDSYDAAMSVYDSGIPADKIQPTKGIWIHKVSRH